MLLFGRRRKREPVSIDPETTETLTAEQLS
jgi:hypothetical protein